MKLVAFVGNDKESWGQITALINRGEWEMVFLLFDKKTGGFPETQNTTNIIINSEQPLLDLKEEMKEKLKNAIGKDFEVALSLASGNGKEHMSLVSALLGVPVGIRLVAFTKKGVEFVN